MKDGSNSINSIDLAVICARTAEEKKGEDIRILDMEDVFPLTDYFLLATGANRRHIQSMTEAVVKALKSEKRLSLSTEGYDQGWWVLIDYGDVVVHILSREAREFYDLENLWGDAQDVDWKGMQPRKTGS